MHNNMDLGAKCEQTETGHEDLAFVVNFIHHPDNTCRSSHRMASCEGKKSSWISDLFDQEQQPVMWLKDGKGHLYQKYKDECLKLGNKPISKSKFRDGLRAGNFKEMVEMAGLCNICDEVGSKNWNKLTELIQTLRNEVSGISTVDNTSFEKEDREEFKVTTAVTTIDLTNEDIEYMWYNPLPVDSPLLMIETGVPVPDFDNFLRRATILKGRLLSDFTTNLQTYTNCAFHCMTLLLNEKACCENHNHVCNDCAERFTLLDVCEHLKYNTETLLPGTVASRTRTA
jgi:hypothetical protein